MLLTGTTCTQFQLWDAIRSLDYLASHPQVDSSRLASTGQSGGGTLSMLLAAVDDRLKTIAVFSGNTENLAAANFLPPGSTDDAEQDLVGAGPLGFDRWDLLYPFAPKPLLISISAKDSFGTYSPNYVSESWSEYRRLAKAYGMMGSPRNLQWADTPLPHGLSYDSRLVLYNWLSRHLKGQEPEIPQEPPTSPEPDAKLWVTPTGNVFKSLGSETPFQWTKKRTSIRTQKRLEDLLGVGQIEPAAVSLRKVPSTNGITIEAVDIESDVHLPAWVFHPRTASKAALIVLHPSGRNSMWTEGGLCHQLATAGLTVCAPDIRGIGDLTPEFSPGAAGYAREHELEEDYAWSSLCLGKPLLGQRVTDIIAVAKTIDTPVAIAAFGKMAIPALFAAALTPSINKIYLAGGLSSYRNIVETENYRHTFADFIPGILAQTDLPEVVAVLAPRHVIIAGAVNAAGALHPAAEVRNTYAAALERGHLEIREKAEWSAAALLQFVA
jgi:dienelactone hydrolase